MDSSFYLLSDAFHSDSAAGPEISSRKTRKSAQLLPSAKSYCCLFLRCRRLHPLCQWFEKIAKLEQVWSEMVWCVNLDDTRVVGCIDFFPCFVFSLYAPYREVRAACQVLKGGRHAISKNHQQWPKCSARAVSLTSAQHSALFALWLR